MAEKNVPLVVNDTSVGEVIFDESPTSLELIRTAYGSNLRIPTYVVLRWNDRAQPCPLMTNLRVVMSIDTGASKSLEVGRLTDDLMYSGTTSAKDHRMDAELFWINIAPALAAIRKIYDNDSPKLNLAVSCNVNFLVRVIGATPSNVVMVDQLTYSVLSFPRQIRSTLQLKYPQDTWNNMLQAAL
jgi:hypothetical protein